MRSFCVFNGRTLLLSNGTWWDVLRVIGRARAEGSRGLWVCDFARPALGFIEGGVTASTSFRPSSATIFSFSCADSEN